MRPAIFFGHGNPMNAIEPNAWTRAWSALGDALAPRPRAVVCVSAHYYVRSTRVTTAARPRTIHDFGGFPRALFEVQYPAPGDPALAAELVELLAPTPVELDEEWGLDHGTWSVLRHVFPGADVPVVQLSIDRTKPGPFHYELGRRLAALRERDVLVIGSGNIVHNLHAYAWGRHPVEPFDWGVRFDAAVRGLIEARDHAPLIDVESLGADAELAVPTPDHYLPLLYVLGASRPADPIAFFADGFDGGSVGMTGLRLG